MLDAPLRPELRPRLRGVSHAWAAVAAAAAGGWLIAAASGTRATVAAAVYAGSVVGLFTTSAVYHRVTWPTPAARQRMRHVDHAAIFVLIAGTFTPVTVVALEGTWGTVLLCVVWAGAALGVGLELARREGRRWLTAAAYLALGWVAVAAMPALLDELGTAPVVLFAVGGLMYTVGAVIYARRRPDPAPLVFGYHEIFHVLVIAAAALHFWAIAGWVLA